MHINKEEVDSWSHSDIYQFCQLHTDTAQSHLGRQVTINMIGCEKLGDGILTVS